MSDNLDITECECCPMTVIELQSREPKQGLTKRFGMWMCPSCIEKEEKLQKEHNSPEKQEQRVMTANELLEQSRAIDQSIQIREQFFNAQTIATIDLYKAIDADDSITNKQMAKAMALKERYEEFSKTMFNLRQQLVEVGSAQRAIHEEFNRLANTLRQEERDKLKLNDINYKPEAPKTIKPKTDRKPRTSRKFDKDAVRNFAAQYNVPMEAVQMLVVSKNMTPEDAAKHMHKMLNNQ